MQDITNLQPVGEGAWGKVYFHESPVFYQSLGLQSKMAWAGSSEKAQVRESDPGSNQRIPTRSKHATKVPPRKYCPIYELYTQPSPAHVYSDALVRKVSGRNGQDYYS